jgi:serine/threonine protein phosphatase PrpC
VKAAGGGVAVKAHGETAIGKVREHNEDALIVDRKWGLYAVFDGMGGASAGDVAANRARDVVHEYVRAKKKAMEPRALIEAALNAASAAVYGEAQRTRDRQGMGTTAVVALVDDRKVLVAHVGDSRAYLLREGRLTQLTRDHTVVMELVAQGAISAVDAENHAYKNVLSRNLGARPDTRPDVIEVELAAGDRLMLCSDGLYGYASTDAIQYLMGSTDAPDHVARDLVDLAMRGGGGDNVTVVVIEAGAQVVPRMTQILRTSGAIAWWSRRATFLGEARNRGLARSPICAVLSPDEAVEIVAGNLCEAIFHDLEKSTGVNVWTYAENLAHGWFDQGGAWRPLADLLDLLAVSARAVTGELTADDEALALAVDAAVVRAFITAEMAVGGVLAERLRQTEADLIRRHTLRHAAADQSGKFQESPTVPFEKARHMPAPDAASPEVRVLLQKLAQAARVAVGAAKAPARQAVDGLLQGALEPTTGANPAMLARELFGVRPLEESGIVPLFDALDVARTAYVAALRQHGGDEPVIAAVMRRLTAAQCEIAAAIATLVVEAAAPATERLKDAMRETASLRAEVGRNEARLIELERQYATRAKPAMLPRAPPRRDRP